MSRLAPAEPDAWRRVSQPEQQVRLYVDRCCRPAPADDRSAIDVLYDSIGHVLTLGPSDRLAESDMLGRLLTLGVVTACESYFRSVLVGVVRICPFSRTRAADHQIAFGALSFYGPAELGHGLVDGASFAGANEVKKYTKTLLGIEWSENSSLGAAIKAYNQVCHMRHASVHAHGRLNRGNAIALDVPTSVGQSLRLVVDLPSLHEAALACTSAVRAYNSFIWEQVVDRWISQRLLTGDWKIDKQYLTPLFELMRSKQDNVGPGTPYRAYSSIRPAILRRLAAAGR